MAGERKETKYPQGPARFTTAIREDGVCSVTVTKEEAVPWE